MVKKWSDVSTLYHIYPRSFQDSDNDGIGDLKGITSRLDYLSLILGVEAIWLSPFYISPMRDFGYDVADYTSVDPEYGNLEDFTTLLNEAHKRNIKVMIDLVPCHTSDEHPWYVESKSSLDNSKRDYYVWKDAKSDGSEPNNWLSQSGGSSWTFDENTEQYYLHSFLSSQPDLNWDNPELRQEILNVVRWWFNLGVDGMRVDAIWGISKDPLFGDDPINPDFHGPSSQYGNFIHNKCKYGPNFSNYLRELSDVCHEFEDKQMIFEFYPDDKLGDFYDQYKQVIDVNRQVASTFFMELIRSPWHADIINDSIERYVNYSVDGGTAVFCLGNHDQQRIVSRIGEKKARAMALLSLCLPGISVIYYGDELGMTNGNLLPDEVRDKFSPLNQSDTTRDLERTPMQWTNSSFAGFSDSQPWLPVNENRDKLNVVAELTDSSSMLSLYRRLINLRKNNAVLQHGNFEKINVNNGYILAYRLSLDDSTAYVLVNFADQPQTIKLPTANFSRHLSSLADRNHHSGYLIDGNVSLDGFEAIVFTT